MDRTPAPTASDFFAALLGGLAFALFVWSFISLLFVVLP